MTYLDSSLLVKRYYLEADSQNVQRLFSGEPAIAASQFSCVEICSALNRKLREGLFNTGLYAASMAELELDWPRLTIVALTDVVMKECRDVIQRHRLRAGDALQLASARILSRVHPVVFGTSDQRLKDAAQADGMTILQL